MLERERVAEIVLREVVKLIKEEGGEDGEVSLQSGLADSGLDSLAFAVLVTRLEQSMGFDPFLALEDEIFPRTVGELVEVYVGNQMESVPPHG
ncbi:phosphopantetheine-binding protein [Micromonospora chalcea]|uniref:phosphopantetheine-binding protein n=1 Tax=Micromonospora chalcea TaxID=1874 RepID=UPI0034054E24